MMTLTGPWKRRPSSWCGAAHRARASVHAGCPQSGAWPHHGTTSDVEQWPQAKIRSLAAAAADVAWAAGDTLHAAAAMLGSRVLRHAADAYDRPSTKNRERPSGGRV
jgi:hypothetical protein